MAIKKWQLSENVAVLSGTQGSARYVVAYPIRPGPQACVITTQRPPYIRIRDVTDALIVLPTDVPICTGLKNPEFSSYLAIAEKEYGRQIAAARHDPDLKALAKNSWRAKPFTRGTGSTSAPQWKPVVLRKGEVKASKRWQEWLIARRWTDWEMSHKTREERFVEHCANKGEQPPPKKSPARKKALETFRAKCRTMNLPKTPFL